MRGWEAAGRKLMSKSTHTLASAFGQAAARRSAIAIPSGSPMATVHPVTHIDVEMSVRAIV